MLIKTIHGWELPERDATPEDVFLNRRQLMAGIGAGALGLGLAPGFALAAADPSSQYYPAEKNPKFSDAGREITGEKLNTTYNNFYEFGTSKRISRGAQALKIRPWEIKIDGEVEKPFTIGFDDLLKKVQLEERVVRLRCVEAWAMTVPWTGFPLKELVALAAPKSSAKYIQFQTFNDPDMAPGQKPSLFGSNLPWPYTEGMTMAEATNELAFMVTGAYGKPVAKSMGAPLRVHCPWKYGFKAAKSINRITFTSKRPVSFWQQIQGAEYGFWANVNPEVPHPRWSQAQERILGTNEKVPSKLFNGYGEFVASLYTDLQDEVLYR
ncbi:Protein-methionine-sulfoxide reductase catalytic subunit MsrP [hydrothermal vent metagenome]|uniref:Protein-methionine-sulfoxide reductase catalytic subunit MsrP n=1 Tax=hydrothermal vent metagenome TaxID=652676 RepID=A0A3B0SRA6_9ZZZZ